MPTKRERHASIQPQYSYNARLGKYRNNANGRFVSQHEITSTLESQIEQSRQTMTNAVGRLREHQINLSEWRATMVKEIKNLHVAQYALGQGGWGKLTAQDYGRIGSILKVQYRYLNGFVADLQTQLLERGTLDGRADIRAGLYASAGRSTYQQSRRLERQAHGMHQERRVLNPAEHCDDCIEYAERGWQAILTLPPIGYSECRVNCKCEFEYK